MSILKQVKELTATLYSKTLRVYHTFLKPFYLNQYTLLIFGLGIISIYKLENITSLSKKYLNEYNTIVDFFKEDNLINVISFLAITISSIYIISKRTKNRNVSLNFLFSIFFTFIFLLLSYKMYLHYPINWSLKYIHVILFTIALYIACIVWRLIQQILLITKNKKKQQKKQHQPIQWSEYIATLKTTILKENLSTQNFSLGIIGSWGSGKTTFLQELEQNLNNDAFIVNFNPWNSHSEKQITTDFFNTLLSNLKPYYSRLSQPLLKYSNLLMDLDISDKVINISKIISSTSNQSLENLKLDVEKCLLHFEKPIIVIIDDLDRLNGDEILEVFKLIRNSAQFKNIIYIVAYDKSYINRCLMNKGITTPDLFIEKLFNLEILLPPFEPETLPKLLCKLICGTDESLPKLTIESIIYTKINGSYKITKYLTSFRAVERFALQFNQNINVIQNHKILKEINLQDFFWLEILQYTDFETYNKIGKQDTSLLKLNNNNTNSSKYLCYNESNKLANPNTKDLIKDLFLSIPNRYPSVQYVNLFSQYFSYRLYTNQIQLFDFQKAIQSIEHIKTLVENNYKTKLTSLLHLFRHQFINETKINENLILNYFEGTFTLYFLVNEEEEAKKEVLEIINKILSKTSNLNESKIENQVIKNIKNRINDGRYSMELAYLLRNLFGKVILNPVDDGLVEREDNILLSNKNIRKLAVENFQIFIKNNTNINYIDYFTKNNFANTFLLYNIKDSNYEIFDGNKEVKKNNRYLLIIEEFQKIFKKLDSNELSFIINDFFNYHENYPHIIDELHDKIKIYFSSTYDENLYDNNYKTNYIRFLLEKKKVLHSKINLEEYFTKINLKKEYDNHILEVEAKLLLLR